jgi:hypothetical protein
MRVSRPDIQLKELIFNIIACKTEPYACMEDRKEKESRWNAPLLAWQMMSVPTMA